MFRRDFWRWVLAVSVPVAILAYFGLSTLSIHGVAPNIITGIAVGIGVVTLLSTSVYEYARSRTRRRRLENRMGSFELVYDQVDARLFPPEFTAEELRLKEYSARREEAEQELMSFLPVNPRRAKRLVNHERLYALIAEDRGIFGGDPELTHRHLAKWVLIVEGWPRLGAALTRNPDGIAALERSGTLSELQAAIDTMVPMVRASDELLQVLHESVPLSPVLARLVRFESAPSAGSDGSGPGLVASQSMPAVLPVPREAGDDGAADPDEARR